MYCYDSSSLRSIDSCSSSDIESDACRNSDFGLRSPGAPFNGGRSVKEIDEQMTNLRKENFNLKLRIYFLEERMGSNFNTDKEEALKKNIELMVELENVRKELEDKQELLRQAAKAIEIEEDEKQKEVALRDQQIAELKNLLNSGDGYQGHKHLSREDYEIKQSQTLDMSFIENDTIKKLQDKIEDLQVQLKEEKQRADHFENVIDLAECSRAKCKSLESKLDEKNCKIEDLVFDLEKAENDIELFNQRFNNLEKELKEKTSQLQSTVADLQEKTFSLHEKNIEIQKLNKLYEESQQQLERQERKAEKHKSTLSQLENKNGEMKSHIDTLKIKILNLENKLEAALNEVNIKNNSSENALSLEQNADSNNIDVNLFSVRNPMQTPETSTRTKPHSKVITQSVKSSHSISQNKSYLSHQTKSSDKLYVDLTTPKSASIVNNFSPEVNDATLTHEELLDLKRNHYKACKIIKTMIQKKNEYVEQINLLQSMISDKGNEIENLRSKVAELVECNNSLNAVQKKKTIQEKVSEMNLTANLNPADNKENSMAVEEVHLAEQYKELANELELKIEVLSATLHEKDNQLSRLKIDLEARSNQIVDLEFEILALTQGVSRSLETSHCVHEDSIEELSKEKFEKEQLIERLEGELKKRTCDLQGIVNNELWEKNRAIEKMQILLKTKDEEIEKLHKDAYEKEMQLNVIENQISEFEAENDKLNFVCDNSKEGKSLQVRLQNFAEKYTKLLNQIEDLQFKLQNISPQETNILQNKYDKLQNELQICEKLTQEKEDLCAVLKTRLEELCHFLNVLLKQKCVLGFLGVEQTRKLQTALDKSLDLSNTLSVSVKADASLLELTNITNLLNISLNDSYNLNELEGISELSIIPSDITLTYQNHFNKVTNNEQSDIIEILRNQITNLKHEIEIRDIELGKKLIANTEEEENSRYPDSVDVESSKMNATSSTLVAEKCCSNLSVTVTKMTNFENQSESESWSEPDRNVSLARIGLNDDSLKKLPNAHKRRLAGSGNISGDSTEDENNALNKCKNSSKKNSLAESRQTVISLHEQLCDLEIKLKDKENQLLATQVAYYETDNLLKNQQTKLDEVCQEKLKLIEQLDNLTKQLEEAAILRINSDKRIEELKTEYAQLLSQEKENYRKLKESEREKNIAEERVAQLQKVVETLEEFKKNVETAMDIKNKEMINNINIIEMEKSKAIANAERAEQQLEKAKTDISVIEEQLNNMHQREDLIRQEFEILYKNNMREIEEHYSAKVKNIAKDYENQAMKCKETVNQIKEVFERDYVKRSDVEKRILEVDNITIEMEKLKLTINESENKMRKMEAREIELKNKVQDLQIDHQNKLYELHKDLDNAALQYSEAILEKTKLKNEYNALEQNLQSVCIKESELISKVNDLQKELHDVQVSLKSQICHLEQQKHTLELRITSLDTANVDLQAANAELHNRFIKLQIHKSGSEPTIFSLPNSPSNRSLHVTFSRQFSDHSGYASEDIPTSDIRGRMHAIERIEVDHERIAENSSPDLGIESDQGRFSSLEGHSNARPLLPTLELTQSMSDLLNPVQDAACCNDNCCKKTKEITNENVELRKRLLRTRRALEETLNRLTLANKQKKEVEKSICKQIHQTSQVLRKAKANLDSGSETDIKN